ncbi:MazG nucleotide pyrophosphohydrolase domain-containing protein [Ohtaekwangia kribbensis]|uniref:MazG nucleotide pyrophosphohydrolase domain-containing protein n=1 Tax=Ohtaekwangia kribbensis TaxID=688913 RepID=A0ABW3K1M6_9BACT
MTLRDYQDLSKKTVQGYNLKNKEHYFLGYLGLAGETGSVLTLLKKLLRDGEGFGSFESQLKEELGDVLWYIAAIASHYNFDLDEVAKINLEKTKDRFEGSYFSNIPRLDDKYEQRFPDSFIVQFEEQTNGSFLEVSMTWEKGKLGDPLTDNARIPNDYRYHDVFHLGHVAFLGWSPVMRHLMGLKRKSDPHTLDCEDRGRPQVAEEAVTLIIFNYAKGNKMLKESDRIDTDLLRTVKQIVIDLEVSVITANHWEKTIIESYKVFHKLVENRGGKVLVSVAERKLEYIGT